MEFKYTSTGCVILLTLIYEASTRLKLRMREEIVQIDKNQTLFQYEPIPHDEDFTEFEEFGPRRFKRSDYDLILYESSCRLTCDLHLDKIIRIISPYKGQLQYPGGMICDWIIVGMDECKPAVACTTMDLRDSSCDGDVLVISDGMEKQKKYCGPNLGFSLPLVPKIGNYLFITLQTEDSPKFKRLYKGISCEIRCDGSSGLPKERGSLDEDILFPEEYQRLCGRQYDEGSQRIVGGETTKKNEFPWQAAIVETGTRSPVCGGSLINDQYILTAAHCILANVEEINSIVPSNSIQILLRGYVLDVLYLEEGETVQAGIDAVDTPSNKKEIILGVERIIVHQFYSKFYVHEDDIALIKLKKKLKLTDEQTPTPICLPEPKDFHNLWEGINVTVTGWGKARQDAKNTAQALQKVVVPTVPRSKCDKQYAKEEIPITRDMLCAGFDEGGKDACQGDSGGPLVAETEPKRWVQVGVVSFGAGCAQAQSPGIYANVARFLPWIRHKTKGAKWPRSRE